MRLPGGGELKHPSTRRPAARARNRPRARAPGGGRPARRRRRARRSRRGRLRRLRGTRHSGRGEHRARRPGGLVAPDRELSRLPRRISGTELTSRAVSQARKFGARPATPYRALGLEPGKDRHVVHLEEGHEIAARAVLLATGAEYRRLPLDDLSDYEGSSIFYAAGPPEAQLCGAARVAVVGGGNSAGQAAVWLARGGALVTLLHRRADLRETMSDYLIRELERTGRVRDRSEIAALHGARRPPRRGHAHRRQRAAVLVPFPVPRRPPCTDGSTTPSPRRRRLHPHGRGSRRRRLLETSVPGSSPPATFAPVRRNAAPRPSGRLDGGAARPRASLRSQPTMETPISATTLHPHLDQVGREPAARQRSTGCKECLAMGGYGFICDSAWPAVTSAARQLEEQARDGTLPRDMASADSLARARRGVEMVLRDEVRAC